MHTSSTKIKKFKNETQRSNKGSRGQKKGSQKQGPRVGRELGIASKV